MFEILWEQFTPNKNWRMNDDRKCSNIAQILLLQNLVKTRVLDSWRMNDERKFSNIKNFYYSKSCENQGLRFFLPLFVLSGKYGVKEADLLNMNKFLENVYFKVVK